MKIPTYRRQTGLPKMISGQPLSSRMDPGAASQGLSAKAGFYAQVTDTGLQALEYSLKTSRATELKSHENEFDGHIAQGMHNIASSSPEDFAPVGAPLGTTQGTTASHMSPQNRISSHVAALHEQKTRQANNISNSTVRARFISAANSRIASITPQVSAAIRAQFTDYSEAVFMEGRTKSLNAIVAKPPGPVRNALIENYAAEIREMGERNFWDDKKVAKEILDMMGDIDLLQARRDLANEKTYDGKLKILDRLDTGLYEDGHANAGQPAYQHLDISRKGVLANRAVRQADAALAAQQAALNKLESKRLRADKEARRVAYQDFATQISTYRANASEGRVDESGVVTDPNGNVLTIPTALEIWSTPSRQLDQEKKRDLVDMIEGRDRIRNDQAQEELNDDIYGAFTEAELNDVEEKVHLYRDKHIIGWKLAGDAMSLIEQKRGNTQGFQDQKDYRGHLQDLMRNSGIEDLAIFLRSVDSKDDAKIPSTRVDMYYDRLIREGARPAEAFYEAAKLFVAEDKRDQVAQSWLLTLPLPIQKAFDFDPRKTDNYKSTWEGLNRSHVEEARTQWDAYASGAKTKSEREGLKKAITLDEETPGAPTQEAIRELGIPEQDRVTYRDLLSMENAIDMLDYWITKPALTPPPEPNPGKPDATENEQAEVDAENKKSATDWVMDLLSAVVAPQDMRPGVEVSEP